MRSAPTLKIWMTPFASVAMLEKLALLTIALCRAPALSSASLCCTSMLAASMPAAWSRAAESSFFAGMAQAPFVLQHLGTTDDRDQRCAQFVRHVGEEVPFRAVRLLEPQRGLGHAAHWLFSARRAAAG